MSESQENLVQVQSSLRNVCNLCLTLAHLNSEALKCKSALQFLCRFQCLEPINTYIYHVNIIAKIAHIPTHSLQCGCVISLITAFSEFAVHETHERAFKNPSQLDD